MLYRGRIHKGMNTDTSATHSYCVHRTKRKAHSRPGTHTPAHGARCSQRGENCYL